MEYNYLDLLERVYTSGLERCDRTGTGTLSLFAPPRLTTFLQDSFPLITTKYVSMGNIAKELRWMLSGSTNIRDLGCGIWDEWADENGDLGPVYGKRFKDQLPSFIDGIKNDPMSRRHIISTWDFYSLSEQRLPPCHGLVIQAYVAGDVISTLVYIRSWDLFLGAPYNIAFYALFTHLIANTTGLRPGGLVIQAGDVHIYKNHLEQVKEQLTRAPHTPPKLHCSQTIDEFIACPKYELIDYTHHPRIKGEVSV